MKKYERENVLLNEIKVKEILTTKEYFKIAEKYDIKNLTARRYLQDFEKNEYIRLEFGAIHWNSSFFSIEKTRNEKKYEKIDLKTDLAMEAKDLLDSDDAIFVSPGTTNEAFIKQINKDVRLLVTNGLEVFNTAKGNIHIKKLVLIGGNFRHQSSAFIGRDTLQILNNYKFNKCFLTGTDIDENMSIFNNNEEETECFLQAMKNSKVKVALFDSSKFQGEGVSFVTNLDTFDYLITNKNLEENKKNKLKEIDELKTIFA